MKVGDILTGGQLHRLPVGSVVVHDEEGDGGFNTVVRTSDGFRWVIDYEKRDPEIQARALGEIHVGGWTLVHLPPVPALKVGDVIETEEQAKALPVGTVVVDDEEKVPVCAPAVKVDDDRWLFHGVSRGAEYTDNETVFDHRILHIPARADTGAVRTAA